MTAATSLEVAESIKIVWPLPKNLISLNIELGPFKPALVTAEFYIDRDEIKDFISVVKQYALTPI